MANSDVPVLRKAASLPAPGSVERAAQFRSPRGNTYRIIVTNEADEYERPESFTIAATEARRPAPADDFAGTDRKAAKLSIVDGAPKVFAELTALLQSLPADDDMINHDPEITTDEDSDRVQEEQQNVRVTAFLYAASREKDNDYHFIVGRDPASDAMYMNMELSGLPPRDSPAFARLKAARDAYKTYLASLTPPASLPGPGYHHYDPPIPIEVEGSLFFDIVHARGTHPGPAAARPDTIWEVHPISRIVFEP